MSDNKTKSVLSERFKEKVISKIPDDFDLAMIGKIDLQEAEKIANEEIVFLSEEDLIDGLEDFELIPVRTPDSLKHADIELPSDKTFMADLVKKRDAEAAERVIEPDAEILFEEFSTVKAAGKGAAGELRIQDSSSKVEEEESLITKRPEPESDVNVFEEPAGEAVDEPKKVDDEILIADEIGIIELDLDEELNRKEKADELPRESEVLKQRIDENQFNHQLDDIVKADTETEHEFIPGTYDESSLESNVHFIDDSHVEKKDKDILVVYESDPLTDNLVKMVDISEGNLIVFNDIAEQSERIEYLLDSHQPYDTENITLQFKEDKFDDDEEFDFIDNAIVRDDYTVYIQEIDDFLRSRESQSKSEIVEILGLFPEESDFIEEKLFGDYYREFEEELDFAFINPELSFFDRGYVEKKELNYFEGKNISLLDEERKSIEDDISSESAIIFEEDIYDIKKLLEESSPATLEKEGEVEERAETGEPVEIEEIITAFSETEIPDISDRIIILEDAHEIERVTSRYPKKKDDLVKLLSYLDGLMEKLPEESIKKFAESEYYDLYVKVLKEIGI